jgi:predicted nucleic acid-binding protein
MRDQEDWPILATALALGCPIWTEDSDFFGCGVATWTSNRVQVFLREAGPHGHTDVREGGAK